MAILKRKAVFSFMWRFVEHDNLQVCVRSNCRTLGEAQRLERECLAAMDRREFFSLSEAAREVLVRLHQNRKWDFPPGLIPEPEKEEATLDVVLWDQERPDRGAIQLFFSDPIIRQKPEGTLQRYSCSILHLTRLLKPDTRMADIWIPELRAYYATRLTEKAAPATIGWEISTLSGIYEVLIAMSRTTGIGENPCRQIRGGARGTGLSFKSQVRQAYLSDSLVRTLISAYNTRTKRTAAPPWLKNLVLTSFYSGMRLGEIINLRRHQVFIGQRMIFLAGADTKEGRPKRVPIHHKLIPVLERAMRMTSLEHDHVFLLADRRGVRPITKSCVELAVKRLRRALNPNPSFHFHDLRHTFRANCSRSDIPDRIAERILGHSDRDGYLDGDLAVNRRYGDVSDDELIRAIDRLTFDHGDSRINGRPVVLNPVSWMLAEGRFSGKSALDTNAETL